MVETKDRQAVDLERFDIFDPEHGLDAAALAVRFAYTYLTIFDIQTETVEGGKKGKQKTQFPPLASDAVEILAGFGSMETINNLSDKWRDMVLGRRELKNVDTGKMYA